MTLSMQDAAPVRRSHAGDLRYLAAEAKKAHDPGLGDVFRHRLERAAKAAEGLAREADARSRTVDRLTRDVAVARDENDMLRAQAADRERALAVLQQVRRDFDVIVSVAPDDAGTAWALGRMREALDRAAANGAATTPKEAADA